MVQKVSVTIRKYSSQRFGCEKDELPAYFKSRKCISVSRYPREKPDEKCFIRSINSILNKHPNCCGYA